MPVLIPQNPLEFHGSFLENFGMDRFALAMMQKQSVSSLLLDSQSLTPFLSFQLMLRFVPSYSPNLSIN